MYCVWSLLHKQHKQNMCRNCNKRVIKIINLATYMIKNLLLDSPNHTDEQQYSVISDDSIMQPSQYHAAIQWSTKCQEQALNNRNRPAIPCVMFSGLPCSHPYYQCQNPPATINQQLWYRTLACVLCLHYSLRYAPVTIAQIKGIIADICLPWYWYRTWKCSDSLCHYWNSFVLTKTIGFVLANEKVKTN